MLNERTPGGDRSAEQVQAAPQTFFLEEAAELALGSILARLDRALNYQPFFRVDLASNPPEAKHTSWDYCDMAGRFVDALILVRQMTGSTLGLAEEACLRGFLLGRVNPRDGLFYNAASPWSRYEADMFCQGRVLLGLVSWFLESGEAGVEEKIERLIAGLRQIAIHYDDYCYYPKDIWIEGEWVEGGLWNGTAPGYAVQQLVGLVRYAEATGSPAARDLAGRLARYFVDHAGAVRPDGSFAGHVHSQGILPSTLGVLNYALLISDERLATWARRVYEYARSLSSSFGWVPDGMALPPQSTPYARTCETCGLADLLELAIKLSQAGLGEYWDDVERFARNQLLENQIREVERVLPSPLLERSRTPVRAILLGSFDSAARPNELLGDPHGILEGCCTAAGARACFQVWNSIITARPEGIFANLTLSRDAPWCRLVSFEPYRGELWLEVQKHDRFFVRLPMWIDAASTRVMVDGVERQIVWRGRYIDLGTLDPGQVARIIYPQRVWESTETIMGEEYQVRWKGGTVVRLTPVGDKYPTYRRAAFEGDPPMVIRAPRSRPVRVTW